MAELTTYLRHLNTFQEARATMQEHVKAQRIKAGLAGSMAEVPDDAVAVLLDKFLGIVAVVTPDDTQTRQACKANSADAPQYARIFWYK